MSTVSSGRHSPCGGRRDDTAVIVATEVFKLLAKNATCHVNFRKISRAKYISQIAHNYLNKLLLAR